jgi:predicted transcriptional regulator
MKVRFVLSEVLRRSQFRIYVDIMRVIRQQGNQAKPTKILYGANLSYGRLVKYLKELKDLSVIRETMSEQKTYELTEKGIEFLNSLTEVESFSVEFGVRM